MQGWELVCSGVGGCPCLEISLLENKDMSTCQSFKVLKFQVFKVSEFQSVKVSKNHLMVFGEIDHILPNAHFMFYGSY